MASENDKPPNFVAAEASETSKDNLGVHIGAGTVTAGSRVRMLYPLSCDASTTPSRFILQLSGDGMLHIIAETLRHYAPGFRSEKIPVKIEDAIETHLIDSIDASAVRKAQQQLDQEVGTKDDGSPLMYPTVGSVVTEQNNETVVYDVHANELYLDSEQA